METPSLNAPGDLSVRALAHVLHEIAFRLAGREELAIRLGAAWEQARQVIACDHCVVMLWLEREVLALGEPDDAVVCSDRLRQRLEWHARMLDGDIAASLEERPLPIESQAAIVSGDSTTAYLSLPLMGLEGVLLAAPLVGAYFLGLPKGPSYLPVGDWKLMASLYLGAGVYEELMFRQELSHWLWLEDAEDP